MFFRTLAHHRVGTVPVEGVAHLEVDLPVHRQKSIQCEWVHWQRFVAGCPERVLVKLQRYRSDIMIRWFDCAKADRSGRYRPEALRASLYIAYCSHTLSWDIAESPGAEINQPAASLDFGVDFGEFSDTNRKHDRLFAKTGFR